MDINQALAPIRPIAALIGTLLIIAGLAKFFGVQIPIGGGGLEMLPVYFLIGLHADYYQPLDESWRPSGGWHYGGGIRIPISNSTALRADFKQRFSPGQSVIILVGVSFSLGGESAAN